MNTAIIGNAGAADNPGGIDFNPQNLNLRVEKKGSGVELPINLQILETMEFDGMAVQIINIVPLPSLSVIFNTTPKHPSP